MIKLTWKIWVMLIFIIGSILFMINFQALFSKGVIVKDIDPEVATSGLSKGTLIIAVNDLPIANTQEYNEVMSNLFKGNNQTLKIVFDSPEEKYVFLADEIPEIIVRDISKTRIKTGLDLQGGARALIAPETPLTDSQMQDLIEVASERFNVYGISDVTLRPVTDLQGNSFMLVEIAGATPTDLEYLVGQQGKFEAKIKNQTVFFGGDKDITYVCRDDATCAGIESCFPDSDGTWFCNYQFSVHLSEQAAKRHADITKNIPTNASNPGYLEEKIEFYLDDQFSTSLLISETLRGQETTQIQIEGYGSGLDREEAIKDAEASMKKMQTILITGSLPVKLKIEKLDTISPVLGQRFTNLILLTALASLIAVSLIIFVRYKKFKVSLVLLFTSFSELIILLGIASLIKWNLDLPSIAGILVMIGTGVDQQIVILDEFLSKYEESLRAKIKRGLFIIIGAYLTTLVSLVPLWWAGAGLLRGFMVTTLIGLTIGVLITRPAFADIIKKIETKE